MINVAETIGRTTSDEFGYYKPNGFSKRGAVERRSHLEKIMGELDTLICDNNDMDSTTRKKYNDLRGMLLHLQDVETCNSRTYTGESEKIQIKGFNPIKW